MGTELFLMLITLCTAFVNRNEMPSALVYSAIAFIFYFIAHGVGTSLLLFTTAAVLETVTIALLMCLQGCIKSKLTSYLIPISILSIFMHIHGGWLIYNGFDMESYNTLVMYYYAVILGLFLSVTRWVNGSYAKYIRFLRKPDSKYKPV